MRRRGCVGMMRMGKARRRILMVRILVSVNLGLRGGSGDCSRGGRGRGGGGRDRDGGLLTSNWMAEDGSGRDLWRGAAGEGMRHA